MAKSRKYWQMKMKAQKTAEICIYEQIGESMWEEGIGAKQFAKDLKALGDVDRIVLRLNSPGGSVFEGLAIYNQLRAHKATIEVRIDGLAASIASVIAMAGDSVLMPANAIMMIHDPSGVVMGGAEDMRKMAEALEKIKTSLITAYRDKCGLPDQDIADLMADETWMSAHEAVEWGFADEVTDEVRIAAHFDMKDFKKVPDAYAQAAPAEETITSHKEESIMENCTTCGSPLVNGKCLACAAQAKERERVREITALAAKFNKADMAREFVNSGRSVEDFTSAVLASFKPEPAVPASAAIEVTNLAAAKPFANLGEQLAAIYNAAKPGGYIDKRLMHITAAASGMGEAVPSDGGFLVQQDFTLALLEAARREAVLAPRCRTIPIGANANGLKAPIIDETSRATGSRWGGVQVYRVDEGGTVTAKKPKFATLNLTLEKLMGVAYATEELLADQTALEAVMTQAFTEELAFKIDDEIINGTGAGQMLGILNAGCLVSITKEVGQVAATIVFENVVKAYARMWSRGKANGVWLVNAECFPQLITMSLGVGAAGQPAYLPPGGISQAPYGTLFGRPVIEVEQCAALGTVGDIIFADMSQYLIIEKGGITADSSMHVRFLYDEMTYRWTVRNNGQPMWKSALTPYKGTSSTVSPFVAVATRA